MPARVNTRPVAEDPRRLLAALMRADATDPVHTPSLTRQDVADVTGKTRSQVDHAVERGWLRGVLRARSGRLMTLFTPVEAARWVTNPYGTPTD